jgi:sodium-dependent dicarboxylate transporter 2/3/5
VGRHVPVAGLVGGAAMLLLVLLTDPPDTLGRAGWLTLGLAAMMALWWATEALPLAATALVPILLVPLLGIGALEQTTSHYANPVIFLFLGGFTLGLAMERCGLHRRLALRTLLAVGSSPRRQIGGIMLATAFLSMWVSNTATTIMMLPIGLSVIELAARDADEAARTRFSMALLLAVAYSASIGGMATLIGTPPNALLAAFLGEHHGMQIGFGQWMLLGVPVAAVLLLFVWWWLTRRDFVLPRVDTRALLQNELEALGPVSPQQWRVAAVFGLTAACWISQPWLARLLPGITDTGIAIAAALLLFVLPAGRGGRLLDWQTAVKMPWGVLLLFGGGLSLAAAIRDSGLSQWLAQGLDAFGGLPALLMVGLVVLMINLLTELTSNTAITATFLPLVAATAIATGMPVELLAIPAALSASCTYMMPVATPPNAIVFGSGQLRIGQMIRTGAVVSLFSVLVLTVLGFWLVQVIW